MAKIPVERKGGGLPWWAWLLIALAILALIWLLWNALTPDEEPVGAVVPAETIEPDAAVTAPVVEEVTPDIVDATAPVVVATEPVIVADETAPAGVANTTAAPTAPPTTATATETAPATPAVPDEATPAAATEPLTDIDLIIAAPDQATFVGDEVQLQTVQVQRVVGDVAFWVGPEEQDQQLLVILDEVPTPGTPTEGRYDINPGQTITIFGDVHRFPGVQEAQQQWNVTDDALLADQEIYLEAERVEIISQ